MAEVGNAAAGAGAAGAAAGSTAKPTDAGGQKTAGAGDGPSAVGNKTKEGTAQLTYHGQPEMLSDGTQVQRATNSVGNDIREERMDDGRTHSTETTPGGDVVSETWTDPKTGTSKTVDTHGDGRTTTTRTWGDGTKEVTNTEPGQPELTEVYDRSGTKMHDVVRHPDGRVQAMDSATGGVSEWNPDAAPTMYGDRIDPEGTLSPQPKPPLLALSDEFPDGLTAYPRPPKAMLGGGMSQVADIGDAPDARANPAPPKRPPAGGGMSQVDMGDADQ